MSVIAAEFLRLMSDADVPGVAAAIVRDGGPDQYFSCGLRRAGALAPVDENTVFEAASLSKPVFAHVVLQLVRLGQLSLNAPLRDEDSLWLRARIEQRSLRS